MSNWSSLYRAVNGPYTNGRLTGLSTVWPDPNACDVWDDTPGERHYSLDIVHKPKVCEWCDRFPNSQRSRKKKKINYTGEFDESLDPCPFTVKKMKWKLS